MKILIFGASGKTGHHLVSQALHRRYLVSAFVRDPSRLAIRDQNVKVFGGNVTDYQAVESAIKNQDAVLSALGASGPFKRDFTLVNGIKNIVAAMQSQNVKRIIYQSYMGVTEHRDDFGLLINRIFPILIRNIIIDHESKEAIIEKSRLDWTIVRCPMLTNGPSQLHYRDGVRIRTDSMLPRISRADVAHFMINEIADTKYIRKTPRILNN